MRSPGRGHWVTHPKAGQRALPGLPGEWSLASFESSDPNGAWHRYSLHFSSSSHNTLRPAPRGSAQESIVRPRRMVEPLEDRRQENFFCGPPGKLQPGQFLVLIVVPTPPSRTGRPRTNLGRQKGKVASWPQSSQGNQVTAGRMREFSDAPARQGQAGLG